MYIPARPARVRITDVSRLVRTVVERSFFSVLTQIRQSGDTSPGLLMVLLAVTALFVIAALLMGVSMQHILTDIAAVSILGGMLQLRIHRQTANYHIPQVLPQPDPTLLQELRWLRETQQWQYQILQLVHEPNLIELQRASQHLTIGITNSTLPAAEREHALSMLATIVNLRVASMSQTAWCDQQRDAMATLWQIVGLTHLPGRVGLDALRGSVERLASFLDLDWIALLAPNDVSPVAPVFVADRRAERAIALQPMHLRIATEAIRKGQPLVRHEAHTSVACLPILQAGMVPLVVVASGAANDESTQSILLLLGDLLARRFERAPVV